MLAEDVGDLEHALSVYERVFNEAPTVTARAEAMMRSGDILIDAMGRPEAASQAYATIIQALPENALSGEARRKIDRLRKTAGRSE